MIEFLKVRNVKSPIREFGNAGIDFFIPEFTDSFLSDLQAKNPNISLGYITSGSDKIILYSGEDILIPSGLKTKFPPTIALEAANKSGVALKKKLIVGAQVIDSNYQGEIHIHLINVGREHCILSFGEKIVQFIPRVIDISKHKVVNVPEEEFFTETTTRGNGGFGSTGTV